MKTEDEIRKQIAILREYNQIVHRENPEDADRIIHEKVMIINALEWVLL